MRKAESNGLSNNLYFSVFVGVCKSEELLDEYLGQHWKRSEIGLMCSQFRKDFNINYNDDKYLYFVSTVNAQMSNDINEVFDDVVLFDDVELFDLNLLKQDYPNHFDRAYNAVIIIVGVKYEGEIQEIQNNRFGYFKFLGTYPVPLTDKINDNSEMDKYAINKLAEWGYAISVANENRDDLKDDVYFKNHFIWKAQKDEKTFTALDPLRLLGIVTIVQEYGDAWDYIDVPNIFSIKFENQE